MYSALTWNFYVIFNQHCQFALLLLTEFIACPQYDTNQSNNLQLDAQCWVTVRFVMRLLFWLSFHYQWLLYTVLASDSSARYHLDQEWSIKCIVFNGIIQSSVVGVRHNTVLEWPMFLSRHIKNIDFDIHSWVNSLLREGHLWSWNY